MKKAVTLAPTVRQIVRNLLVRKDGTVWAGYLVGQSRWDYTGRDQKVAQALRDADVFAALAGRYYSERVSARPHPVRQWAQQLDRRTPAPTPDLHTCDLSMDKGDLLRGRCGCETWNGHLVRMQNRIAETGMNDKVVFRYFSLLTSVSSRFDVRAEINKYLATGVAHDGLLALLEDERKVHDIVTGWSGSRRMNEYEQGWLRVRSLAPGVQPSTTRVADLKGWDEVALPALSADMRWHETPFGRTVTIMSVVDGRPVETAARVLSLSRCDDLDYPANGLQPWQTVAESCVDSVGASFAVEWSVTGRLMTGAEMAPKAARELRRAKFIDRDYREHGEDPPSTVARAISVAQDTHNQVTTGQAHESARFWGQINVVITGQARFNAAGQEIMSAADVVEERCAIFTRLYASSGLRMEWAGADCQSFMLRSTIPGEPGDGIGFQRRLRLPYLAYGMPNVTSVVGDRRGPYLGYTRSASRRAVMHDPHFATEGLGTGRSQNMHLVVSTLGGGKSVLLGSIAHSAARRGVRTVINDPSGPLAALTRMPEIAAVSQEINLLHGERGILSPAALVPNPRRDDFDEPGQWAEAVEQARSERRDLTVDVAWRCLPEDLVSDTSPMAPRTREALRVAARRHADLSSWETTTTLWDLVAHLEAAGTADALAVASALRDASTAPLLRLLFPHPGADVPDVQYSRTLTVITTPGISRAADGTPRRDWTPQELGADVLLRLVALFTNRMVYDKARSERAIVIFDEAESMTDYGPGRAQFSRLGRDHSKWNLAVYLGVKTVSEQMISGELGNFLASTFVGRMAGTDQAQAGLTMLGLSDPQYVEVLLNLSSTVPGEFVHKDVEGRVGAIRVDVDYHPALKAILLTDPTPQGADVWALDPEEAF